MRYPNGFDERLEHVSLAARGRGYLTKNDLVKIGDWKSPRIRRHIAKNSEEIVYEATLLALGTASVRLAPQILMALDGVGLPMASTILHWCHPDPFPILDFRALWTLGCEMPSVYTLDFWEKYVESLRSLRLEWDCEMRTLDKALWQYSKEHQS